LQWPDRDEAFLDVVQSIRKALERMRGAPSSAPAAVPEATPVATSGPRSSNLRIAKTFSNHDRDRFVIDAYDYVASFFENSLGELRARHPELEGIFRRIDAERFTDGNVSRRIDWPVASNPPPNTPCTPRQTRAQRVDRIGRTSARRA